MTLTSGLLISSTCRLQQFKWLKHILNYIHSILTFNLCLIFEGGILTFILLKNILSNHLNITFFFKILVIFFMSSNRILCVFLIILL